MRIPTSANHPAESIPSGAPPEINHCAHPPKASRILLYTSLSATFQLSELCVFPVEIAQLKIFDFTGDAADFPSTAWRIFSYTLGTATKTVGFTVFIAA